MTETAGRKRRVHLATSCGDLGHRVGPSTFDSVNFRPSLTRRNGGFHPMSQQIRETNGTSWQLLSQLVGPAIAAALLLLILPASVMAQSGITGVARDTSGAVLPGVT